MKQFDKKVMSSLDILKYYWLFIFDCMEDWTEKYRPKFLDEVIGNERAIVELRKWAKSWDNGAPKKRAVILSGKPGTGKTSSAIALANDYKWALIELNASDARNASNIKRVATHGAVNETFDDHGHFISSKNGGRKLIVLDEADNLYEKIESTKTEGDYSDKGGKKAIIDTIKVTSQPMILIVNDYYNLVKGGGESLKNICELVKFYDPPPSAIFNLLRKISTAEDISVDLKVLQTIADRSKGDVRSAINDLQSISLDKKQVDIQALSVLGYRDREKIIFDALREIFKTKNIKGIKDCISNLDADPENVILWINENLPVEYKDFNDMAKGYEALSKADIFLGRTRRKQNYSLWSYACDIMNGGVALAKTHEYYNERYNFPMWLREIKDSKPKREIRDSISKKISKTCHSSSNKSKDFLSTYFVHMFRNDTEFAIKMKQKLDLAENEIEYLLGKKYTHKLKDILQSSETIAKVKSLEEVIVSVEDERDDKQHSLFDF